MSWYILDKISTRHVEPEVYKELVLSVHCVGPKARHGMLRLLFVFLLREQSKMHRPWAKAHHQGMLRLLLCLHKQACKVA